MIKSRDKEMKVLRAGLIIADTHIGSPGEQNYERFDLKKITKSVRNRNLQKYIRNGFCRIIFENFTNLDAIIAADGIADNILDSVKNKVSKKLNKNIMTFEAYDLCGTYGIGYEEDQNLRNMNTLILGEEYTGNPDFEHIGSLIGSLGGFVLGVAAVVNSSRVFDPEIFTIDGIVPLKSIVFHPLNNPKN